MRPRRVRTYTEDIGCSSEKKGVKPRLDFSWADFYTLCELLVQSLHECDRSFPHLSFFPCHVPLCCFEVVFIFCGWLYAARRSQAKMEFSRAHTYTPGSQMHFPLNQMFSWDSFIEIGGRVAKGTAHVSATF